MTNEKLTIKVTRRGYTIVEYEIVGNLAGYTNDEIINLCDPNNFGGDVRRYTNGATVTVYID